jgi:hypothetical protein
MAGVHCLHEIEGFRAADLADDNSFRTHTQAASHEITHRDRAAPFKIWRPRFETNHMRLLQLQFGRVLASNHAFVIVV